MMRHARAGQVSRSRRGPSAPARRGFTTLSGTLGQLAAATHAGLLQALAAEPDAAALAALLRALGALVAAAPYLRLPPDLLPRAVQARTARALCPPAKPIPRCVLVICLS